MTEIRLNGAAHLVPDGASLSEVVAHLTVAPHGVAVALDGTVIPRSEWDRTVVQDRARVEVLTAVQGG